MKHPIVFLNLTPEDFAKEFCNLRYDAMADYLDALSVQLKKDAKADAYRGYINLSNIILNAAENVYEACLEVDHAWDICKDKM